MKFIGQFYFTTYGQGTILLTTSAWNELEKIFEQLKIKYVKYKIWQDE